MANSFTSWLLASLLDASIKGLPLLLAAALAMFALRQRSSSLRHLVGALTVLALIALPIVSNTLPGWSWPRLILPPVSTAIEPSKAVIVDRLGSDKPRAEPGGFKASSPSSPAEIRIDPPKAGPSMAGWLALAWSLGALATLGPWVVGVVVARRRGRRSRVVESGPWSEDLETIGRGYGIKRKVTLRIEPSGAIPSTWGFFRAVVFLPSDAEGWSPDARRAVLRHELAHVSRGDFLTQGLSRLACALYWFNPLVWVLDRRVRDEAEAASDDLAMVGGSRSSDYARHLVDVVRALQEGRRARPIPGALAMARSGSLEGRILAILDPSRDRRPISRRPRLLASLAALFLMATLGTVRLTPTTQAQSAPPRFVEPKAEAEAEPTWKKDFPDGLSVEILGVGPFAEGGPWWSPDGSRLIKKPAAMTGDFVNWMPLPGSILRDVAIRIKGADDRTSYTFEVNPGDQLKRVQRVPAETIGKTGRVCSHHIKFDADARTCTFKVGVAVGPWKTSATFDGKKITSNDDRFRVRFDNLREDAGTTWITLTDDMPASYDERAVAVDRSGKVHEPWHWGVTMSEGQPRRQECRFGLSLDQIQEIQFRSSPWTWHEFPPLALTPKPGAVLDDPARPRPVTKVDGKWIQAIPGGMTVELLGVGPDRSKPRLGEKWWKPDGSPLEQEPGVEAMSTHSAGPGRKTRQIALKTEGVPDNAYLDWMFKPGGSGGGREGGPSQPDGQGRVIRIDATFPAEATEAHLKFGIASGPWTTLSSSRGLGSSSEQKLIGEKPATILFSKPRESQGETSIVVTDTVELLDQSRVVAIDVDGQVHQASEGTTSGNGSLRQRDMVFRLPMNRIARFELQSRLSSWVEFPEVPLEPGPKGK